MDRIIARFAFPILLLILAALAATGNLFSSSPAVIAGQVIGLVVNLAARAAFRQKNFRFAAEPANDEFLRSGPYRYVRHPMYAGMIVFSISSVLGHLSLWTAVAGLAIIGIVLWRVTIEERLLRARYPDFSDYASATKRLVPFVY